MRVLVVCKGNTCRSPMFAAVLALAFKERGLTDIEVESAGILREAAGQSAATQWTYLQGETGIDLSAHKSRWVGDLDLREYGHIIAMEPEVIEYVMAMNVPNVRISLANDEQGGIPNPWLVKTVEAYRDCFHIMKRAAAETALLNSWLSRSH